MKKLSAYSEDTTKEIENLIDQYSKKYFEKNPEKLIRIKRNIWAVRENYYSFSIIITSMLIIFDTNLFEELPKNKNEFFKELLALNAHHVKSSKLCLVKNSIHLRIIRGLEGLDYSEFVEHIEELNELYPEIQEFLSEKYYKKNE